ncbi:MAG: hypothetical protein V4469_02850 [Patescibacteria group bacterium]
MTQSTPENDLLIQEAFAQMERDEVTEVTYGPGFILVKNPDVEKLQLRGQVLQSFSIQDVPLAVLSPGVSQTG